MSDESAFIQGEERPGIFGGMIKLDASYFNTWLGRVKILELIFITLAGCILPSVIGVFFTRYSFYTFIVWTAFMYIVADVMLHITSLWRLLPGMCTSSAILMYPVLIGALAFLLGSSLVASVSDQLHTSSRETRSGLSSACGFITMILFLIEAFLHYRQQNQSYEPTVSNNTNGGGQVIISMPVNRDEEHPPPYTAQHATPAGSYTGDFV